jgi:hypothetical protein
MAMAARIPMIATTIINSINVKPFWTCFNMKAPWKNVGRFGNRLKATAFASDPDRARPVPEHGDLTQGIEFKEFIKCRRC